MKKFVLTCVSSFVIVSILMFFGIAWYIFGGYAYFVKVPEPMITYAEFPFCLTYEIDGKLKSIEDSIVCEFDGFIVEGESGKFRKWKTHLKSGNERLTLLDLRSYNQINEFGQTMLELYFYYGNAEYYMGDINNYRHRKSQGLDSISYYYKNTDGTTGGSGYKADIAYKKYKIRLISFDVAEPIQNTFSNTRGWFSRLKTQGDGSKTQGDGSTVFQ